MFAAKCREDLEIGEEVIDEEMIASTVATIASTGKKKRDMTKFSFDGKEYPKNRYIHKVVKNFSEENPGMSLDEFSAKVPRSTDFRKDLSKLNFPTLIVAGRYDGVSTPEYNVQYKTYMPKAQFVMFENSAHNPYLEEPDQFYSLFNEFFHF